MGDFFTKERTYKYRITEDDKCERCGNTETLKHLMWECRDSRNIWELFNSQVREQNIKDYSGIL
jgi:hypothetical protein